MGFEINSIFKGYFLNDSKINNKRYQIKSIFKSRYLFTLPYHSSNTKEKCVSIQEVIYSNHCELAGQQSHYGHFWEILSQNWGMNFYSYGLIFVLFLKILAFNAQKSMDHLPYFEIFEIEAKLHLQGLNFKLDFWDKNFQIRPQCNLSKSFLNSLH